MATAHRGDPGREERAPDTTFPPTEILIDSPGVDDVPASAVSGSPLGHGRGRGADAPVSASAPATP
ncbi:hypothetical protein, partial [Roseateles chitinivorans]|uniref:hypothetical protein n=1 Tax=Roseateles chitinivorans TaxID=2917965 RepID=UPI001E5FC5DB